MRTLLFSLTCAALLANSLTAEPTIAIKPAKADQKNVVVTVALPEDAGDNINSVKLPDGKTIPAQITGPELVRGTEGSKYLTFVLPELAKGAELTVIPGYDKSLAKAPKYKFSETEGKHTDLFLGDRAVWRFINAKHDTTDKDTHDVTFKPFHHVYEPAQGKYLLTSGAYPFSDKSMQFPHHRGLFYGWMRISYGDNKKADTWHGRGGEFTQYEKSLSREEGPVLGREVASIGWYGQDGILFAEEQRELTAYNLANGTLIDFASVLSTKLPKVRLDGDPQHAGFHFRATQEVSKNTKGETYFLRPSGKGDKGKEVNWDAKGQNPAAINLPWNAMSFVTNDKRYTVVYLDNPNNPKDARYSERTYGRFGSYFEYDLTPDNPLKVRYRVFITEGELTQEQCQALSEAFVNPPEVQVKTAE